MKVNLNDLPDLKPGIYTAYLKSVSIKDATTGSRYISIEWAVEDGLDTTCWDNLVFSKLDDDGSEVPNPIGLRRIRSLLTAAGRMPEDGIFDPDADLHLFETINLRVKVRIDTYEGIKRYKVDAYLPPEEDTPKF